MDVDPIINWYSDSDYAGCTDTRKSTTGYVFFLHDSPISWCSTLQPIIATSSTYAEYIAMASAAQESSFLTQITKDMGAHIAEPVIINADNLPSIFLAENHAYHKRSKHIDVKFHYIRECVSLKRIKLKYCPTKENTADIFTKQLPFPVFTTHRKVIMGTTRSEGVCE